VQKFRKSVRNGLEQQEKKTVNSTDVNIIEEGKGTDMVPTGDSKQIYCDQSTSERMQTVQNT
jgi:hypothetical protein